MRAACRRIFYFARVSNPGRSVLFGWLRIVSCRIGRVARSPAVSQFADGLDVWRSSSRRRDIPLLYREAKECGVNPEPFLQLDRVIHEKGRLAIMSMLAA